MRNTTSTTTVCVAELPDGTPVSTPADADYTYVAATQDNGVWKPLAWLTSRAQDADQRAAEAVAAMVANPGLAIVAAHTILR